jgi:glycosyltransferase involved in cell wall biosynthesis
MLMRRRTLYLFESSYAAETFRKKIGEPRGSVRIIHNGVGTDEFDPIPADEGATDLVFLGELRHLKGIDVLLEALALLHRDDRIVTLSIIGDGPLAGALRAQASELGLTNTVRFLDPMPARLALAKGRTMVVPSRSESLPYVVLEAAAAGKPLVATRVGGIPEIFGPQNGSLIPPGDSEALAKAISHMLDNPRAAEVDAKALQERIASGFSVDMMVDSILAAYQHEREQMNTMAAADAPGRSVGETAG